MGLNVGLFAFFSSIHVYFFLGHIQCSDNPSRFRYADGESGGGFVRVDLFSFLSTHTYIYNLTGTADRDAFVGSKDPLVNIAGV